MKTLYVGGDSLLHRLPPRLKILGLTAASITLFFLHTFLPLSLALLVSVLIYASLRLEWRNSLARLRPIFLTIAMVAFFMLLVGTPQEALAVLLRLTSLMLLAAAVTATTGIGDFIEVISATAAPLERFGIMRASDIGLAVGLVMRFVPEVIGRYRAIAQAHHARGLKPRPLTLAIPLIILTLKNADEIAAAIDARGVRTPR